MQKIKTQLSRIADLLGVGENKDQEKVHLTQVQNDLAVSCLQKLQSIASEIMMYGAMANAVSWDKINNLKQVNFEKNKFSNQQQKILSKMRSSRALPLN